MIGVIHLEARHAALGHRLDQLVGNRALPLPHPGVREHADAAGPPDQRERVERMQRVLGHPGAPAVGDELLGERGLLVRHDAGLDHRLRHVRAGDRVTAGDLAHAFEVDRVTELLELLDHQLAPAEPRVGQALQLGPQLLVRGVDPVGEHVQARPSYSAENSMPGTTSMRSPAAAAASSNPSSVS